MIALRSHYFIILDKENR